MSRILVIDDDHMVAQLLEEFLTGEGHEVAVVHSGDEGFKLALEFQPDLILQDVMLPDATGFQMVDRFRLDPNTKSIPIIMMSGAARHPNQQKLGNMMGADDYVLKPFDIEDIERRIQRLIRNAPQRSTVLPPPAREAPPVPQPTPEPPPREKLKPIFERIIPANNEPIRIIPVINAPPSWEKENPPYTPPQVEEPIHVLPLLDMPTPIQPIKPVTSMMRSMPGAPRFKTSLIIFGIHLLLASMANLNVETPLLSMIQAITQVVRSWTIVLGLVATLCAATGIILEVRQALRLVGWAMIPLLMRSLAILTGISEAFKTTSGQSIWQQPPDLFELACVFIIGIRLRSLPGSSQTKAILSGVAIFLLWTLAKQV